MQIDIKDEDIQIKHKILSTLFAKWKRLAFHFICNTIMYVYTHTWNGNLRADLWCWNQLGSAIVGAAAAAVDA